MVHLDLGRAASLVTFGAMALGGGATLALISFIAGRAPIWYVPGKPGKGVGAFDYIYQMLYEVDHVSIEEAQRDAYYIYREQE